MMELCKDKRAWPTASVRDVLGSNDQKTQLQCPKKRKLHFSPIIRLGS